MIKSGGYRTEFKRREVDAKKKQFASARWADQDYPYRLNLYGIPPTSEISLEQFETWAIDRLRSKLINDGITNSN